MNDFEELPFESEEQNDKKKHSKKTEKIIPKFTDNNIIILDDRIKDIPPLKKSDNPQVTDNNIIILDDIIKDIPAKDSKISFKKTSIIFPVLAFIFVSILGMYIFVNNSKADSIDLIKIQENKKIGYIDNTGTVIARCKYIFGTDFYKGHAIVKNNNNLYGIINSKGVLEVPFGNYYYIGLFNNRYIVSKLTNNGLKQALLNEELKSVTDFKYDTISYSKDGIYLFSREETMGILDSNGKEIYTFKVDEVDDRKIDIEISELTDKKSNEKYAKVKINESSTIIDLNEGKEIYTFTLKDIHVMKNNVFYIKADNEEDNSTYIVVGKGKVRYKTDKYKRIKVDDINSDIALAINNDTSIDYINLNTQKVINENSNNNYSYGSGLVLEKTHDFDKNMDIYNILSSDGKIGSFSDYEPVNGSFINNALAVKKTDGNYNYVNSKGELINNNIYDEIKDFSNNGYAIVKNNQKYGIINTSGKEVVPLSYNYIRMLDDELYDSLNEKYKKQLFVYRENNLYGLITSKDKIYIEAIYDEFKVINNEYPIIIGYYNQEPLLINLVTGKELPIKLSTNDIKINDNYIIIENNYYNYSGKLIYTSK